MAAMTNSVQEPQQRKQQNSPISNIEQHQSEVEQELETGLKQKPKFFCMCLLQS